MFDTVLYAQYLVITRNIVYSSQFHRFRNPIFPTSFIDCICCRPIDNIGFSYVRRKLNSCLFKQSVSTHNVKLAEMRAIYDKVTQGSPSWPMSQQCLHMLK